MVYFAEQKTEATLQKKVIFSAKEVDSGIAKTKATLLKSQRHSTISPPLAGVQPSGKSTAGRETDGTCFGPFALVGVFCSFRAVNYAEKITEATLPTRRPAQFFCRCWYFLRLHVHFCRKNNPGSSAEMALRSDLSSATGSFLVCGHVRLGTHHGDSANETASLS